MLLLSADDVRAVLTPADAIGAVEEAFRLEAEGACRLPARLTTDLDHGWFRVMPGALGGVFGAKVMNLTPGKGLYYLVLLYEEASGELLAQLDASVLTQLRTGAVSAAIARRLFPPGVPELGLLGSGFEARGQLEMLALALRPRRVRVYSPSRERRLAFARETSAELGIEVEAVERPEQAVAGVPLLVLATKSREPVLDAAWLAPGSVLLSIGSTRRDLREVDCATLRLAGRVIVDSRAQTLDESADVRAALAAGDLAEEAIIELKNVTDADLGVWRSAPAPLVFKPGGTALQDLTTARLVYERCLAAGRGQRVAPFLERKPTRAS